jgi:hypothetical protein
MFGRGQHGDVLDALVVGLAGLVIDRYVSIFVMGFHERLLGFNGDGSKIRQQKKTAGSRR